MSNLTMTRTPSYPSPEKILVPSATPIDSDGTAVVAPPPPPCPPNFLTYAEPEFYSNFATVESFNHDLDYSTLHPGKLIQARF